MTATRSEYPNHLPAPDLTCIGCGCDDSHPCLVPIYEDWGESEDYEYCSWIRWDNNLAVGLCSGCENLATRWDAGLREHPRIITQ